jgi:type IV pilus assembly protein PilB
MSEESEKDLESVDLESVDIEPALISILPEEICRKYCLIPISRQGTFLTVAMGDPSNVLAIDEIRFRTGFKLKPVFASKTDITKALDKHFGTGSNSLSPDDARKTKTRLSEKESEDLSALEERFDDAPVVKLIDSILRDAVKKNVSYIHLDPQGNSVCVRFRLDGVLRDVMKVPLNMKHALNSRMKIITNLNISERRVPQEGRIHLKFGSDVYEAVVSTLPTNIGERIVIQLLQATNKLLGIEELGFSSDNLAKFKKAIKQPSGLVIIAGLKNSGKKTTLYSTLDYLNVEEVNILTVENPINIDIDGIGQTLVREDIGLTYVTILESMMHQDPDIIMVQKMGDLETVEKVFHMTMNGHLILSSMDVNDTPTALLKLIEMGISPAMINSSVCLVLGQRLLRKVCDSCMAESSVTKTNLASIKEIDPLLKSGEWNEEDKIYIGKGCDQCGNSGYKGRVLVSEALILTPKIKQALLKNVDHHELRKTAEEEGMTTMAQNALKEVKHGKTTLDECFRMFSLFS